MIYQQVQEMQSDLLAKKETIIKQKFAEKGLSHLLGSNLERRFKPIMIEKNNDIEKWYADDGTIDGLLVVTFITNQYPVFTNTDGDVKVTMDIKYY